MIAIICANSPTNPVTKEKAEEREIYMKNVKSSKGMLSKRSVTTTRNIRKYGKGELSENCEALIEFCAKIELFLIRKGSS